MASIVSRLSLALSLIALALAGYSIYQHTQSAMESQLITALPAWLQLPTFQSANVISYPSARKSSAGKLSDEACVFSAVKEVVDAAIDNETRMGASLIRLFFHDCFVDGCDAGLLLNDTPTFQGEQGAPGNNNSVRGFEVIEQAKQNAVAKCADTPVSCADILSIAARDSFEWFTGATYTVILGRLDARSANFTGALNQLVGPSENLTEQIRKFGLKGFNERELVALLGSHTLGFARCPVLCNNNSINPVRIPGLQCNCPVTPTDPGLVGLDPTPGTFDQRYYADLVNGQGLLFSDQQLMNSTTTSDAVMTYRDSMDAFLADFAAAMVKMSNLPPSAGVELEIRDVCSRVNDVSVASV